MLRELRLYTVCDINNCHNCHCQFASQPCKSVLLRQCHVSTACMKAQQKASCRATQWGTHCPRHGCTPEHNSRCTTAMGFRASAKQKQQILLQRLANVHAARRTPEKRNKNWPTQHTCHARTHTVPTTPCQHGAKKPEQERAQKEEVCRAIYVTCAAHLPVDKAAAQACRTVQLHGSTCQTDTDRHIPPLCVQTHSVAPRWPVGWQLGACHPHFCWYSSCPTMHTSPATWRLCLSQEAPCTHHQTPSTPAQDTSTKPARQQHTVQLRSAMNSQPGAVTPANCRASAKFDHTLASNQSQPKQDSQPKRINPSPQPASSWQPNATRHRCPQPKCVCLLPQQGPTMCVCILLPATTSRICHCSVLHAAWAMTDLFMADKLATTITQCAVLCCNLR